MLKKPLCSPVSVLKEPKMAGSSKIHSHSLLPFRILKLCKNDTPNWAGT